MLSTDWLAGKKPSFALLQEIVCQLRGNPGCPWDRKQTALSLVQYLREENSELIEAIEFGDPTHVAEEMGDLLFVLILLLEIYQEKKLFTAADVFSHISHKMIRRHPHVFAGAPIGSEEDLHQQWESIKKSEKKAAPPPSVMAKE